MGDKRDPYRFADAFERSVLRHLVLEPRFWARVGEAVEPDAFSTEERRLVALAASAIGRETGKGAGSGTLVVQRVQRWRHEGRVTHESVLAVDDLVGELEDLEDVPDADAVVDELLPVIRERRNREAVRLAMKKVATRDDLTEVIAHLQATARLGATQVVAGTKFGPEALAAIRRLRKTEKLSTGIVELDTELAGGPPLGTLSVVMGGAGDGKSMFLCHVSASALLGSRNVAVATLELNEEQWLSRLTANVTGIPIDGIADGTMDREVEHRLGDLPPLGNCVVGQFAPEATTVEELVTWVDALEQREGWGVDVLVVDYADLLGHSKARDYEGMREVYSGLREEFAVKRSGWVWTASQSRRKSKPKEKQGADDAADSQHKIRVSDLWIVLSMAEDGSEIEYRVAKNRGGKRGGLVTLPTELECARIAPLAEAPADGSLDLF